MKARFLALIVFVSILAACQTSASIPPTAATTPMLQFTPWNTPTSTPTPTATNPATATPLPTPSPTPRTHVVREGEDMFGIAWRYGITVDQLKTLNPTVNPYAMGVGMVLLLPNATPTPPSPGTPEATPTALILSQPVCHPTRVGGLWCFALVRAPLDSGAEAVSAAFRLVDGSMQTISSQTAYLPLDSLPAGTSLPLATHFSPPIPSGWQAAVEIAGFLPLAADDPRYLSPRDFTPRVDIQGDGLWADVSGSLSIQETGPAEVRLLAVAYDSNGNPVGFRRRDDPIPLSGGSPREFSLTVYSAGPPISRVEVIAEIIIEPASPTPTP